MVLVIIAVLIGLLVVLEVSLRLLFGFGNPLTYIADQEIGYLLAPNQRTKRFGNRITINEYSMRGSTTTPVRPASTLRVLLLGDSIANGGWWTDQAETLSALITQRLESAEHSYNQVEVLNASANSWGPRNELAYIKRFGTFDAQVVVLLLNTDDLFSPAPTSVPVGRDRYYPSRKPPLALVEAFTRFLPYQPPPAMAAVNAEPGDRVGFNLQAVGEIQALVKATEAEFLLAMTPLLREIGEPGPHDYELKARERLTEFTENQQITYLDFLPVLSVVQTPEALYRDHIHLNLQGSQKVSEAIGRSLQPLLPQVVAPVATTET